MSVEEAGVIDCHAHVVLAETMGAAGSYGPEIGDPETDKPWFRVGDYVLHGVRYVGSPFMDPDLRVKRMDVAGISFQVISPNPLTYFHYIPAAEAIAFCKTHNDAMAAVVAEHPDRLGGVAALPIQDPIAARDELMRAVTDLGLWGGGIGTATTHPLDSEGFDTIYETFTELDVPLFMHPGPAGIDGPPGDVALGRFDLDLMIGFAAQESTAVATLIFGGVLERHPALDICLSHGGGMTPFIAGRLAQAAVKRPWAPEWVKGDGVLEEKLSRLWYDVHVQDPRALDLLIRVVGMDQLVYGTNFAGWDQPREVEVGPMAGDLADNARRLLRKG
jgi:aminocarboxymuconate-semialdehyde decarboxylase